MIRLDSLKEEKQKELKEIVKEMTAGASLDVFKKMKNILNAAFGADNNQITKPPGTVEELLTTFSTASMYYTTNWINQSSPEQLKQAIDAVIRGGYVVTIRFPEVVIQNSKKQKHLIRDLFVKINFDKNGKAKGPFIGLRATMTAREFRGNYQHSHISGFDRNNIPWCHFCTGTGPINNVLAEMYKEYKDLNFQLFCAHLKNFVAYESLEGTPYMNLEDVTTMNSGTQPPYKGFNASEVNSIVDELMKKVFKLPNEIIKSYFNISVQTNKIVVIATDEFEREAAKWMQDYGSWSNAIVRSSKGSEISAIFAYKDSKGDYVNTVLPSSERPPTSGFKKTPILFFKKEPITFKVIAEEVQNIKKVLYVNPVFTNKLCEQLSRRLSTSAFNLERAKVSGANANKREAAKASEVPM